MSDARRMMHWASVVPALALLVLVVTWGSEPATSVLALVGALLAGAVLRRSTTRRSSRTVSASRWVRSSSPSP